MPEAAGPRRRDHAEHVGPLHRVAVLEAGDRVDEPRHLASAIERPAGSAALDRDDEDRRGHDIFRVRMSQTDFSRSATCRHSSRVVSGRMIIPEANRAASRQAGACGCGTPSAPPPRCN